MSLTNYLYEQLLPEENTCENIEQSVSQTHTESPELKCAVLPLGKPFYSTYHFQGIIGAISLSNPSVRNWYLNESMSLCCERVFLFGFSSPHINILQSSWLDTPCFDKLIYPMRFLQEHVHELICKLIDNGYYVNFDGVDDYYLENKSWYQRRHFCHDGLIYGYDEAQKTYDVYAYDSNWSYRGFKICQDSFVKGRDVMMQQGTFGTICGVKPHMESVDFQLPVVYTRLSEYLDSSMEKYPLDADGKVSGIVVHQYMAIYLDRLYHGLIQYNKMDWRIFRVIWEQKAFMLERIQKIEQLLDFGNRFSKEYDEIVREANTARMLYASHHQKRRDNVLPVIKKKLLAIYDRERKLLEDLLKHMDIEMRNH